MSITIFIIVYGILNAALCFSIVFRQKRRIVFIPVFVVAAAAIVHGFIAQAVLDYPINDSGLDLVKIYFVAGLIILFGLLESIRAFFKPMATTSVFLTENVQTKFPVFSLLPWRILGIVSLGIALFIPYHKPFLTNNLTAGYLLAYQDTMLLYLRLILCLGILFLIENIYRYAQPQQRRMARISFIAFALLVIFDVVFTIHMLLFSVLTPNYIEVSIIVCGVCITMGLFGFTQYRVMEQKVVISRAGIYSSITLVLAGVLFLVLGTTVFLVQRMGMQFSYFEEFLAVFSLLAFIIVIAGSKWVRLRIAGIINRHFYKSKYDYRDQFFRLHQTYMAGEKLEDSLDILLENLVYSAGIGEVLVFIRNEHDGNYYLHLTPESKPPKTASIRGDSPLIAVFNKSEEPCFINNGKVALSDRECLAGSEDLVKKFEIAAVFPIQHQKILVGILAVRKLRDQQLDNEDVNLIKVFCVSIGNVFAKYRMLEERLEYKQFESFHHIASFIVHDIKNQVATLSLVMRNAEKNITNPDFQKSLLKSVGSCSQNLQKLIDKLSIPVKQKELQRTNEDVNAIVKEVVETSGLRTTEGITLVEVVTGTLNALVDRMSIFYITKNLVVNAIEAMNGTGTLTLTTGATTSMPDDIKSKFDIGEHLLANALVYIIIKDTGPGMSRQFMEEKLFRPFMSTKDKGIGIGLYQCKTLLEKMDGALLCHSKEGEGSEFCVVV